MTLCISHFSDVMLIKWLSRCDDERALNEVTRHLAERVECPCYNYYLLIEYEERFLLQSSPLPTDVEAFSV